MNFQLLLYGLIEIVISLITGLIIFFISFKIFSIASKNIKETDEIQKNNIAVGIVIMAFVFAVLVMVKESVGLSKDAFVKIISADKLTSGFILTALLRVSIIYMLSSLFSIVIIWISMLLFMFFTKKIEEMNEIKNNNTAVAILLGTLIVSVAMILLQPLSTLLNSLAQPDTLTGVITAEPLINKSIMLNGLIELAVSFCAVIFIFLISFIIFGFLTKNIDEIAELKANNNAISILVSSFIFSMMLLIKNAVKPAYLAFEFSLEKKAALGYVFLTIGQMALYFIVAGIIAFIVLWLGMKCFMLFTKSIDEMSEIKKNNIAISLILAILLISTALLVGHGLEVVISSLVKTPPVDSSIINLPNF